MRPWPWCWAPTSADVIPQYFAAGDSIRGQAPRPLGNLIVRGCRLPCRPSALLPWLAQAMAGAGGESGAAGVQTSTPVQCGARPHLHRPAGPAGSKLCMQMLPSLRLRRSGQAAAHQRSGAWHAEPSPWRMRRAKCCAWSTSSSRCCACSSKPCRTDDRKLLAQLGGDGRYPSTACTTP